MATQIRSCPLCWGKHDEGDCPNAKRPVPPEVWAEVYQLQFALADLTRALITDDDNYIVGDLGKLAWHRNRLVNLLQTWRPTLRIAADED